MKKRIFSSVILVAIGLIIFITSIVTANYYSSYSSSQVARLKEESQLVIKGVELNGSSYFENMDFDNYRITWIKSDGSVIYDSASNGETMENHLEREEVQEALKSGYGESKRYSKTILKESVYVAYKIDDGSVIRLSCIQNSVFYLIASSLYPLYFVSFVCLVIAIAIAYWLSYKITEPLNRLDLENISSAKTYKELQPLLNRIESQRQQLVKDKDEIEKTSLMRQEFTANVTHEMKTPLHIIAGYSELMKEGIVKENEMKDFSSKIYMESYRMTKLVDDILELSKLDNGVLDEDKDLISLDSIAQNVADSLESLAAEKNVTIITKLESVDIFGAKTIIHSMIYNLVENAIKYNKENGQITVSVKKENAVPVLTVSDTGIGIPDESKDRVFERFYRVDKSHSREIGGTGLGLSIVKHAALVHNARIILTSKLGEGSTFRVEF